MWVHDRDGTGGVGGVGLMGIEGHPIFPENHAGNCGAPASTQDLEECMLANNPAIAGTYIRIEVMPPISEPEKFRYAAAMFVNVVDVDRLKHVYSFYLEDMVSQGPQPGPPDGFKMLYTHNRSGYFYGECPYNSGVSKTFAYSSDGRTYQCQYRCVDPGAAAVRAHITGTTVDSDCPNTWHETYDGAHCRDQVSSNDWRLYCRIGYSRVIINYCYKDTSTSPGCRSIDTNPEDYSSYSKDL